MPELPEVQTIVNELKDEIIGKRLRKIEIKVAKMVFGDEDKVKGLKIENVRRRAKVIIIELEKGWYIAIHLKLTGQLFFLERGRDKSKAGEGIGKFTHIIFHFEDGSRLVFNDLRKFGYVKILDSEGLEEMFQKENYGPEPLQSDFTLNKFQHLLSQRPAAQIKPLLMDQTFIAGIGNLYSDEILFYAGVHPRRKAKELSSIEVSMLYKGIKAVLNEALKYKGSSIDTYRRTTGEKGTFEFHRKVYRRRGENCIRCGAKIQSIKFGNRTAYFCPRCQT